MKEHCPPTHPPRYYGIHGFLVGLGVIIAGAKVAQSQREPSARAALARCGNGRAKRSARHGAKSVTAQCRIRVALARLFAPVSCKICDAPWGNSACAAQILRRDPILLWKSERTSCLGELGLKISSNFVPEGTPICDRRRGGDMLPRQPV